MNIRPFVRKPQYYETDQMGIIHHANYIHWFEEARADFMEQIGFSYEKSVAAGIDFAVLSVTCNYKSMVRYGDTIHIQVCITGLTPTKLTVAYEITDAATGKLRTTGESLHCFYDSTRKRPVSLKKALPELYDLFASLCTTEGKGE